MKKSKKEVKSDGKVVDTVEIPEFESLKEMVAAYTEAKVLGLANRQLSSDITNEARAARTRTTSPTAQLTRMAKANPELQAQIDNLLKKYNVEGAEK